MLIKRKTRCANYVVLVGYFTSSIPSMITHHTQIVLNDYIAGLCLLLLYCYYCFYSDPPPPVATVDFKMGSDGKSIVVSWLIIKDPVLKTNRKRRNVNPNALKWDYALIRWFLIFTDLLILFCAVD